MKKLRKIGLITLLLTFMFVVAACGEDVDSGDNGDNDDNGYNDDNGGTDWDIEYTTLIAAQGDWPSNRFHSEVARYIIENGFEGYEVETSTLATAPMLVALRNGTVDFHMELWTENMASLEDDLAEGKYELLSTNFDDNNQGIYIPYYTQEEYGIYTIQDLVDNKALFPDEDMSNWDPEYDKAVMYGGPTDWEITNHYQLKFENEEQYADLIEAFEFRAVESTSMLNATMTSAYNSEEAWVGYYWEPSYIMGVLDMVLLDDEIEYDMATGAGNPPAQAVMIGGRSELEDDHPEVYAFLSNYETSAQLTSEAEVYMSDNDLSAEETAAWWVENHTDVWNDWVDQDTYDKIIASFE